VHGASSRSALYTAKSSGVPCADGSLFRIDVGRNAVTGPWPTNDGNPFVLDGHGSMLWAPDYRGMTVARIDVTELT
jgi:hypothetical protein